MDILAASEQIKTMYRNGVTDAKRWKTAISEFHKALEATSDAAPLEEVALRDENWESSVEERIALLKRAKKLGASSHPFLCDHWGFIAMHTEPGPDYDEANAQLEALMNQES